MSAHTARSDRTNEPPVNYEEAALRVARGLAGQRWSEYGTLQSGIANLIWPKHRMRPQGAALAAGRFTRRLHEDKVIIYASKGGWRAGPRAALISAEGRWFA